MRILLVEDDERLVEALLPRLYAAGWEAEACGDGEEGWLLAQSGAYDAIALDRMLPGLDGLGLLRRIRGAGLPVPVIFITALDAVGDRVEGLDAGADDYLTKPFAAEELLARLRALAGGPGVGRTMRCCAAATCYSIRCGGWRAAGNVRWPFPGGREPCWRSCCATRGGFSPGNGCWCGCGGRR